MSFFKFVVSREGRKHLLRITLVYAGLIAILWGVLRWYTDHGEQVSVPDLKGMSFQQASLTLEEKNLQYLIVDSIYNEGAISGSVLDQSPAPESKVKEGRKIFLTVYSMLPPMEKINIKEGDFAQVAIIKLKNKGIKFDVRNIPNNNMVGSVVSVMYMGKKLKPNDLIARGERVIISVGIADSALIQLPNLQGLSYYNAMAILDSLNLMGLGIFEPEAKTTQDSGDYHVCRQNPGFGPEEPLLEPGKIIDFWLSKEPCSTTDAEQAP